MTISFSPAPTLPSLSDPATFSPRALSLFEWLTSIHIAEQEGLSANDFFDVLGAVSQSGGVPTGSITERGSNANGEYARFADGTQICSHNVTLVYATAAILAYTWTFPAAFAAAPTITASMSNQTGDYTNAALRDLGAMTYFSAAASAVMNQQLVQGASGTYDATSDAANTITLALGRWF